MADYFVFLGDVVDSRAIFDRDGFRHRLVRTCSRVNERYDEEIHAELQPLKGVDEIGGVLSSGAIVYRIVRAFADALHPHQLRIAVVLDEIDVGAETGVVSKMDGPAFHRADELLDDIEGSDLLFDMQTGREPFDLAVADEINLLLAMRQQWTDRQREIIECYERHENQYEVADELDISQQAVSKALNKASWPVIAEIEKRLGRVLRTYDV